MEKIYDLQRFIDAQNNGESYEQALSEIKAGRKKSHWIWYIFPQLKELGFSRRAKFYGIEDINEAKEYLNHEVLGTRLIEISQALLNLEDNNPRFVMGGYPDDMKLKSCMTLFACISENDSVFHRVLKKFFNSEMDNDTLKILEDSQLAQ